MEIPAIVGALLGLASTLYFWLWDRYHPKSKEIRRLRGVVAEAHREHRELRIVELEHAQWESRQYQGWLRVHQAATRALKEYGPLDPYRGQAAPGREGLVEIRSIAAEALSGTERLHIFIENGRE